MFKIFSDNTDKNDKNVPVKSTISEQVFAIMANNEFTLGTIKAVQTLLGMDKVKEIETEIADSIIKELNSKDTQAEAFLFALFSLMHYASALESLEDNFLNWKG